jgi:tRNA(Glu) U13 pseudouridine synthase TruD
MVNPYESLATPIGRVEADTSIDKEKQSLRFRKEIAYDLAVRQELYLMIHQQFPDVHPQSMQRLYSDYNCGDPFVKNLYKFVNSDAENLEDYKEQFALDLIEIKKDFQECLDSYISNKIAQEKIVNGCLATPFVILEKIFNLLR